MRFTRGDIGFFRRFAAAECFWTVADLVLPEAVALLPVALFVGVAALLAGFGNRFEDVFEDFAFAD